MKQYRQLLAAGLLVLFAAALLAGCGAQPVPEGGWQISPPGQGPTVEADNSGGYTLPAETTASSTSTAAQTTTTTADSTTSRPTSRPTEPITVEDDPQRPKEEDKEEDSGPAVTLPPVTTTQTTTTKEAATTTTAAPSTSTGSPDSTGAPTTGSTTQPSTAAPTSTTTTPTTTRPPVQLPLDGIDVSTFQSSINWNQVKAAGVDFTIIRAGFRGYGSSGTLNKDARFDENMKGATQAGIDRGVYFFSQAITVEEAKEEARYVLNLIKDYEVTYPIAFDFENPPAADARTQVLDSPSMKSFNTDLVIAFCDTIREAGYYPILYTGLYWLNNRLDVSRLEGKYDIWIAQYSTSITKPGYDKATIWQYASNGRVPGISGNVDLNKGYVDYATLIREQGLNHLS